MSASVNTFKPSQLVSLDGIGLLKKMDSVILKCAGSQSTETFNDTSYEPGLSIAYKVSGYPTPNRGPLLGFTDFEQRSLFITANAKRWYFSVSYSFNQADNLFYINRKSFMNEIVAPTIRAIKDQIEVEGLQYLAEHSPVIPSYGKAQNEVMDLVVGGSGEAGDTGSFNYVVINWLEKLRRDLVVPTDMYKLILNTRDDMFLANSLQNMFNAQINSLVTSSGKPPSMVAGFQNVTTPYLNLHKRDSRVTDATRLQFVSFNGMEQSPKAVIYNASGTDVYLNAADIVYHIARDTDAESGLHWWQRSVKRSIPDSRVAFCITSETYIDMLTETEIRTLGASLYTTVKYKINANSSTLSIVRPDGTTEVPVPGNMISISHVVYSEGFHQNISRAIVVAPAASTTADQFGVLKNHYKNFAVHPRFFQFKCFKLPHLHTTDHSRIDDPTTGIRMLTTYDRIFAEASTRGNILDIAVLPCFGSVPENLFTLPTNEEAVSRPASSTQISYKDLGEAISKATEAKGTVTVSPKAKK